MTFLSSIIGLLMVSTGANSSIIVTNIEKVVFLNDYLISNILTLCDKLEILYDKSDDLNVAISRDIKNRLTFFIGHKTVIAIKFYSQNILIKETRMLDNLLIIGLRCSDMTETKLENISEIIGLKIKFDLSNSKDSSLFFKQDQFDEVVLNKIHKVEFFIGSCTRLKFRPLVRIYS